MNSWLSLITTLSSENATARQRIWRALKACGAAVLRDGVYLMPDRADCRATLDGLATDVRESGGTAHLLRVEEADGVEFKRLFDRGDDYAALLTEAAGVRSALTESSVQDVIRQARKLRKAYANLAQIDFFPGEPQRQADTALRELEQSCARLLSPDEPQAMDSAIERLAASDFLGRCWATRQRPWVDRLASAWLIRRFIDPQARILWLAAPDDCPPDALGFDFDGARFSHLGSRVTFEVLATSFGLDRPAIARLGLLVHCLDVGGVQPPEAAGIESVLAGLRATLADDDALLEAASAVFDGLHASFDNKRSPT
jgi:hypothetical protein